MDFIKRRAASAHCIAAVSLILSSCATVAPLEYPPDHPANPAAPAAPVTASLSALASYKSFNGTAKHDTPGNEGVGEAPQVEQSGQESGNEHRH